MLLAALLLLTGLLPSQAQRHGTGTVVPWGENGNGHLNLPTGLKDVAAVAMGYDHSVALKSDGTVAAWGDDSSGQTNVPAGWKDVLAIAAGGLHTVALSSNRPPVADAGGDQTVTVPHAGNPATTTASFTLDGSASTDPDNDALTYQWTDSNNVVVGTSASHGRPAGEPGQRQLQCRRAGERTGARGADHGQLPHHHKAGQHEPDRCHHRQPGQFQRLGLTNHHHRAADPAGERLPGQRQCAGQVPGGQHFRQMAAGVQFTGATLGGVAANQAFPLLLPDLRPGDSRMVTLTFKVGSGAALLSVSGTSSLGGFSLTQTVIVP